MAEVVIFVTVAQRMKRKLFAGEECDSRTLRISMSSTKSLAKSSAMSPQMRRLPC